MSGPPQFGNSVGHGHGQADAAENRQVRKVVP